VSRDNYLKFNELKIKLVGFLTKFVGRGISILAYIFPFIEISYYFGAKVFLSVESSTLQYLYTNYISKVSGFYEANSYLVFIVMVAIFMVCSRGTVKLSRFVRFNIIQAILINILCSCVGSIFTLLPLWLRESVLGLIIATGFYLGVIILILYASLLIFYGLYPSIPVVSEAARLQVFRGYIDEE